MATVYISSHFILRSRKNLTHVVIFGSTYLTLFLLFKNTNAQATLAQLVVNGHSFTGILLNHLHLLNFMILVIFSRSSSTIVIFINIILMHSFCFEINSSAFQDRLNTPSYSLPLVSSLLLIFISHHRSCRLPTD